MKVFKYRGGNDYIFKRDLESIENNTFWAPTREVLNDPCEGLVSSETLLNQINLMKNIIGKNNKAINNSSSSFEQDLERLINMKDSVGIYSLSKNCTDELLWAHYADNHQGFCIEYDLETLISFQRNYYYKFDIEYSSFPPKLNLNDIIKSEENIRFIRKLIGFKSIRWAYEQEVRLITPKSGLQDYDYRALKAIYFGIRMPKERKLKVMKRLCGRGIKYYNIKFKNNSYKFTFEPIEDSYPTDKKYMYSIAPIDEYAIDPHNLDKKWVKFSSYLYKMAEITRREPYCNIVRHVDVSVNKSKLGKPVFFGQYEISNFRYENLYLTLEEIDERYSHIHDLDVNFENT
ncbi:MULTISPECIES: DUF2971 domain-containing protein [Psychrobacter]|uniref:DUF2971 domain-containing protein n=1 Tax=Psychrobacter TaxID=497 RepID=UPI00146AC4A5|nr:MULTISPECIES: DUF2971 domain-containing protein [Psychrobacter]